MSAARGSSWVQVGAPSTALMVSKVANVFTVCPVVVERSDNDRRQRNLRHRDFFECCDRRHEQRRRRDGDDVDGRQT